MKLLPAKQEYIIDTDTLFSKDYLKFKGKGLVTLITIYEFILITRSKRIEMMKIGSRKRAEGYLKLLNLVIGDIKDSIIEVSKDDMLESMRLVFDREINVGDAVNVVAAKKIDAKIVSNDKDYTRVKDLVRVISPVES